MNAPKLINEAKDFHVVFNNKLRTENLRIRELTVEDQMVPTVAKKKKKKKRRRKQGDDDAFRKTVYFDEERKEQQAF